MSPPDMVGPDTGSQVSVVTATVVNGVSSASFQTVTW